MLRKKNITLNGKKADGSEILKDGDLLCFFFSDETFFKFAAQNKAASPSCTHTKHEHAASFVFQKERILYEDEHILLYNKPAGLLSQKARAEDISLNDLFLDYMRENTSKQSRATDDSGVSVSRPSICNRLDRNTSGIVICGKTYYGLRTMNTRIAKRQIGKYYHCIVAGRVSVPIHLKGYLKKDEKNNKVLIKEHPFEEASYIETEIVPVQTGLNATLLEVHLITGKTHQIRSHLAYLGHPIIGDYKYGNARINRQYKEQYGLTHQLLHAYRLILDEKEFLAPKPELFIRIEKEVLCGNLEF